MRHPDPTAVYSLELSSAHPLSGRIHALGPEAVCWHMHAAFELGVLLAGRYEHHFESTVLELHPGDVWFMPAWEPHGWRGAAADSRVFVLEFLPGFIGEEVLDGRSWLSLFACPAAERPRVSDPATRAEMLSLGEQLGGEAEERTRGWATAVRLGVLRILFLVSRHWDPQPGVGIDFLHAQKLPKLMPALQLVYACPQRRVEVAEAGFACAMGMSHFAVTFRRVMGLSFGQFALRFRLSCAAKELTYGDLSVEAVAAKYGFADLSHFSRTFKRIYQSNPARYRRESLHPWARLEVEGPSGGGP